MDLMTLAAKLELNDSSYRKGIIGAEAMGQQLAGKMSAMTVAVGNLTADMIRKSVSAINNVISGAIDGYADYQQLIGGVETLFKGSADKVAKYAKQSFKTTGLSSNQYMETVTSFSASLLQGLKGDTETAADLANLAVTDMADNANKMGTDISSIQAAYQGFAKQNYTMLDNLKLGYGGTASEMVRLINDSGILEDEIDDLDGITFDQLVQAIHKIQEEMGITGTTAKEAADTISGSKASLQAAWADFLTSVGGETDQKKLEEAGENFETAFSTYVQKNLLPSIKTTLKNTPELIQAVTDAITEIPTDAIREMTGSGLDILTAGVEGATSISDWLLDGLINTFNDLKIDNAKVVELGTAIGNFIGSAIGTIVTNAGTIFEGIFNVGIGLAEGLADGLFKGLFGDDAEVDKIADALNGSIEDAEFSATKSGALIEYLRTLKEIYGDAVQGTTDWKTTISQLEQYIPDASRIIRNFGSDVDGALDSLDKVADRMRDTAVNAALMTALQDSYGLLAEQSLEYEKQKSKYNMNKAMQDQYRDALVKEIQNAAQAQMDEMDAQGELLPFQMDQYAALQNLVQGLTDSGLENLKDLDLGSLWSALHNLGIYEVDNKDSEDYSKLYDEAQKEIDSAQREMEASEKEIEATEKEVQYVKDAVSAAAKDLGSSFSEANTDIESGGENVYSAFMSLAKRIDGIQVKPFAGVTYMPKATGMDRIPFNGFRAELHKDEAILTPKQAEAWRNGGGTSEVVGALQTLGNRIENMKFAVGKKTFGRVVVDYGARGVNRYIEEKNSREATGYGT